VLFPAALAVSPGPARAAAVRAWQVLRNRGSIRMDSKPESRCESQTGIPLILRHGLNAATA